MAQANADEGADPSGDLKQQNPGGTTTADLTDKGGDQDPAAPQGSDKPKTGGTKMTGPGEGANDDTGLSHAPSGG